MNIYPSHVFLFLIGSLVFLRVSLIGVLTYSEIITMSYFVLNWKSILSYFKQDRMLRMVMLAWVAYLAMQMLSDMLNRSLIADYQRGWARLIFFALNIIVIAHVSRFKLDRMAAFFIGYVTSLFVATYTVQNEFLADWKFGYGPLLTMTAGLLIGFGRSRNRNRLGGVIFLCIGLIHLMSNARSLGGLTLFIGLLSLFAGYFHANLSSGSFLSARFLLPVLVSIFSIYQLYSFGAASGMLGEKTKDKFEKQTAGGRNVVSGGRMEYTIALPAIMESPVIGYGSWARNIEFVKRYIYINKMDPSTYDAEYLMELGTIPTHSHILGSWAEAGFMGGVFWLIVLWFAAVTFYRMLRHLEVPFRIFFLFTLAFFIWDIIFSPFGLERRIMDPAVIILIAALNLYFDGLAAEKAQPSIVDDMPENELGHVYPYDYDSQRSSTNP